MKPGRELDSLIAERVIGLKPFKKKWESGAHSGFVDGWIDSKGYEIEKSLPKYSADISSAYELVENLSKKEIYIRLSNVNGKGKWRCATSNGHITEFTELPSHAICLAALKVVGTNEEKNNS